MYGKSRYFIEFRTAMQGRVMEALDTQSHQRTPEQIGLLMEVRPN